MRHSRSFLSEALGVFLGMSFLKARSEFWEEDMGKFKLGDKVRKFCSCLETQNIPNGSIRTVKYHQVRDDLYVEYVADSNDGNGLLINSDINSREWELVEEEAPTSELEELVKKANEGYDAVTLIRTKYSDQVEAIHMGMGGVWTAITPERDCDPSNRNRSVRIKTKPAFEPFPIAQWMVSLDGQNIKVGCKSFMCSVLKLGLQMTARDGNDSVLGLKATKNGIKYKEYQITWDEADQLIEACTKAGF